MWEPRHLTTLWASMAYYRDSFTFTLPISIVSDIIYIITTDSIYTYHCYLLLCKHILAHYISPLHTHKNYVHSLTILLHCYIFTLLTKAGRHSGNILRLRFYILHGITTQKTTLFIVVLTYVWISLICGICLSQMWVLSMVKRQPCIKLLYKYVLYFCRTYNRTLIIRF
jgi:hypothetical protein